MADQRMHSSIDRPFSVNPYQSPRETERTAEPAVPGENLLGRFQIECIELGVGWLGAAVAAPYCLGGCRDMSDNSPWREWILFPAFYLSPAIGFFLGVAGMLTLNRTMLGVLLGLVLSCTFAVMAVLLHPALGVFFLVFVLPLILQGLRVLRTAKQLRVAGIPLTARPADLILKVDDPRTNC